MAVCSAYGCKNRPEKKIKGTTFHRFPKNILRRQQWILATRRANWMPSKHSHLCSLHFEEKCFDRTKSVLTTLKREAVPTIFGTPLANQELLKPKTESIEPLEDISNDKNRILVVPDGMDVQATFCSSNECNNDNKNVVVIKNETDCKTILNCGNEDDADDNRVIIVSDGTNVKTEWCGIVGRDYDPNEELPPYDPNYGLESCRSDYVDYPKLKALISFDPEFYVRRIKTLTEKIKKLQSKRKVLNQTSRRRRRTIERLQKELYKIKKNILPPKCSTCPIVIVVTQDVSN